ncbi:hypothetical protein [Chryseobacterium sp. A321]
MKKIYYLLIFSLLVLSGCKKESVDATTTQSFRSSINDMTSKLSTLQQVKFNEALYILKTFGVDGQNDIQKLDALGKKIDGLKVPAILAMADQVAKANDIAWSSTGPPSLGEMNIFGSVEPTEFDPNDIKANGLEITTIEIQKDSVLGPKALQVIPRLVDSSGRPIEFSGAALETVLVVSSGGSRLSTSKNLMLDNEFKGFTIHFGSLPSEKVVGNKIDIQITVKTTSNSFKMAKVGVLVNPNALRAPAVASTDVDSLGGSSTLGQEGTLGQNEVAVATGDPKTTVTRFLNQVGTQNLRGAYEVSSNPNWGSFESFSNPNTGFGGFKSIHVKNISSVSNTGNNASVNATYDVTDKAGNTTALQVSFGLRQVDGQWKINSYTIIP